MADDIEYEIIGNEMQFVEVILDPAETAIAEAGAMMYMEQGIQLSTEITDGSKKNSGLIGTIAGLGKRALTGESLFITHFTNKGSGKLKVAFSSPFPGKIIALDLSALGGNILCQKEAFLCGAKGVGIGLGVTKRISTGFFGGEGFVLQRLVGDGIGFIHAGGTVKEKTLAAGETIYVDTGCIVAMQPSIDFDILIIKGVQSMLFAGEGFFLSKLTGPGKIWLQSFPYPRFLENVNAYIESNTKQKKR